MALSQFHVLHVPVTAQFVDIFTKGLATKPFQDICFSLNVVEPPGRGMLDYYLDLKFPSLVGLSSHI